MSAKALDVNNGRVNWVDVAKGLGILFVVFGHTGIPSVMVKWVWSFHMPFFFFISGLLFSAKKHTSFIALTKSRANSLLKPYLVFSIVVIALFWYLEPASFPERWADVLINGWGSMALWFIPVLFLAELLFFVAYQYGSKKYYLIILFLCSLAGLYLSAEAFYFPYKMEVVLNAVLFYGLGQFLSSALKASVKNLSQAKNLVLTLIFLVLNILFCFSNHTRTDMAANKMGQYQFYLLAALTGTLFLLFASVFVEKIKISFISSILKYLGKNTFVILAFHQIIMMCLIDLFNRFNIPSIPSTIIRHSIMWGVLILLITFVNAKLPFVLGRPRKPNEA